MTPTSSIPVEIHPKFMPLLATPHSFANIYGGRGGMKSEQTHKVALVDAIRRPLRTCCARETMSSIKDSSHKLLEDAIHAHGMAKSQNGPYEVQQDRILRKDGDQVASEFIFVGIRENVRDSKSLKGINRTIIEEAGKVSQDSWTVFVPTVMREEGSQLWAIWNPELTTDATYKLLMLNPPSNTIHITTTYLDNPWLSTTMRTLAEDSKRQNPKEYEHIWLGKPITELAGAIFADEMRKADAEKRICSVPYDPTRPVHTAWDLGFGDKNVIWFVQAYDGYLNFIDFLEDSQKTISHYIIALQDKAYMYGVDHLPHDAIDNIIHHKLIGNTDKSLTIPVLMGKAGRKVQLAPKLLKKDSLNAARTMFPLCRFDAVKCADGIQGLRHYQWDRAQSTPENPGAKPGERKPLHDWASHRADGFMTAAVSIKRETYQPGARPKPPRARVAEI